MSCCYILKNVSVSISKVPLPLWNTTRTTCTRLSKWVNRLRSLTNATDAASPRVSLSVVQVKHFRVYALLGKTPKMSTVKMQFFF